MVSNDVQNDRSLEQPNQIEEKRYNYGKTKDFYQSKM